jgi:hypothetical protein
MRELDRKRGENASRKPIVPGGIQVTVDRAEVALIAQREQLGIRVDEERVVASANEVPKSIIEREDRVLTHWRYG